MMAPKFLNGASHLVVILSFITFAVGHEVPFKTCSVDTTDSQNRLVIKSVSTSIDDRRSISCYPLALLLLLIVLSDRHRPVADPGGRRRSRPLPHRPEGAHRQRQQVRPPGLVGSTLGTGSWLLI